MLGVAFMLASAVGVTLNTYGIAFLLSKGLSLQAATVVAGVAGIAKLAGRLATSSGRWVSAENLLRGSMFVQAASLLLPVFLPTTAALIGMMAVFGATSGARTILRPLLIVELLGKERFATRSGLLQTISTLAKAVAPVGAGVLVTRIGFDGTWTALAGTVFSGGLVLFLLPAPEPQPSPVAP